MTDQNKTGTDNAESRGSDAEEGDIVAEKKLLARRRILAGTAAAGAVLATVGRAHAQLVNVSQCISTTGIQDLPFIGALQGSVDVTIQQSDTDFVAALKNFLRNNCT